MIFINFLDINKYNSKFILRNRGGSLFFHGIKYEHLLEQYPILNPLHPKTEDTTIQKSDREGLIELYGFEPIHLLKVSKNFPIKNCIKSCFVFGDVILIYHFLPKHILRLSENERGVSTIDVRNANKIIVYKKELIPKLKEFIKNKPIILVKKR